MRRTSAFIGIAARKQMYAAKSSSVASSALLAPPVIRPVLILLGKGVTALTRLLMSAMDVRKLLLIVRLPTSTAMMQSLQNVSTENVCLPPEPVLT